MPTGTKYPTSGVIPCPRCGAALGGVEQSERHGAFILRVRRCATCPGDNRVFTVAFEEVIPVGQDPFLFARKFHLQESEAVHAA